MRRKTYTSPEVKNRWNDRHYDKVIITVPKGAREEIKKVAAAHGLSVAAYVRTLIIKDTAENPETTPFLRGGGCQQLEQIHKNCRTGKRRITSPGSFQGLRPYAPFGGYPPPVASPPAGALAYRRARAGRVLRSLPGCRAALGGGSVAPLPPEFIKRAGLRPALFLSNICSQNLPIQKYCFCVRELKYPI